MHPKSRVLLFALAATSIVATTARAQSPYAGRLHSLQASANELASPYAVELGDLNGDGVLDVVAAEMTTTAAGVSVCLGDGRGGFGPNARRLIGGPETRALALFEANGDGQLDAALINEAANAVTVVYGNGAGGWLASSTNSVGGRPLSVAAGDVDGDGDADLVASTQVSANESAIAVLVGDGAGAFSQPVVFPAPHAAPGRLLLADLDGDNRVDVVWSQLGTIYLRRGTAASLLGPVQTISATVAGTIATADLNEDGLADLVALGEGSVMVYLADGQGGFRASVPVSAGTTLVHGRALDFDGDLHADVLALDQEGMLHVLKGNGRGGLVLAQTLFVGATAEWLATGDLAGDGSLDVVIAARDTRAIHVFTTMAPGRFPGAVASPLPSLDGPFTLADVTRDGAADAMVVDLQGLTVWPGDLTGRFAAPRPSVGPALAAAAVVTGDLDGDGNADVLAGGGTTARVWRGDGTGGFIAGAAVTLGADIGDLALGDLDRDGRLDAIAMSSVGGLWNGLVQVLRGDGSGGLVVVQSIPVRPSLAALALADFDGDGDLDVATIQWSPSTLLLHFNDGSGRLVTPATEFALSGTLVDLATADLDADADADLAIAASDPFTGTSELLIVRNDGRGGFQRVFSVTQLDTMASLVITDVDGDADLDVVAASRSATFAVFRNLANGRFDAPIRFVGGTGVVAADVDADGRIDLVSRQGALLTHQNLLTPVPGTSAYGIGTPGCAGRHGMATSGTPRLGAADFALVTTNAPANALGVHYISAGQDLAGTTVLGIRFHVDFLAAPWVRFTVPSGPGQTQVAVARLPIPNAPELIGANLFVQSAWFEPTLRPCQPSLLGFSSSRGLLFTVQP